MVAQCDIDPDDFWALSFYEMSLLLYRFNVQADRRISDEQNQWRRTSVIWSVLMNGLFGGEKGKPKRVFTPDDLIRFDDGETKEVDQKNGEDLLERVKRKHGATV